jgi:hypothetical protein
MARSPAEIEGAWRSVYKGPQCFIAGGFFALADEVHKQGLPLCRALAGGIRVAEASDAGSLRNSSRTELGMFPPPS